MAFVAPGVYVNEIDLSQYAARISTAICGVVGGAQRGPFNTPTPVTSELEFVSTFGKPIAGSYLSHFAIQFLRQGSVLYVCRIGDGTEDFAEVAIPDSLAQAALTATALTEGTWANSSGTAAKDGLNIILLDDESNGSGVYFIFQVEYLGRVVEEFHRCSWDSASADFFVTKINAAVGGSNYISVAQGTTNAPVLGKYALTGGINGTASLDDADFVGQADPSTGAYTGLKTFLDSTISINILATPGASATVMHEGVSIAEQRADCVFLIDPPLGLTVQKVIQWSNGTGGLGNTAAFTSSYAALFWPWVEYLDSYTGLKIFTPPSGWAAAQFAYNDRVSDAWFAPAGVNRGRLTAATRIEYTPKLNERQLLQAPGQIVNPIINDPIDGIMVYGQATCQRTTSALDRLNVRRMMLYIEKVLATSVRSLVFEPNDAVTWRRFEAICDPALATVKARRGLNNYQLKCDAQTNTADLRNNKVMRGVILVEPTNTAEKIQLDFAITAQGASFSEALQAIGA